MLINCFNPYEHKINRIVLGSGAPESYTTEKEVVRNNLPFRNVLCPKKEVDVFGLYSLDGKTWSPQFPVDDVINKWKESYGDIVTGIISFRIRIVPDMTLTIRELGFFVDDRIFVYKLIDEFIVGKVPDYQMFDYNFNYNLKCVFASSLTINMMA